MKVINKSLLAVAVAGTLGMGSVSVMAEDGVSANMAFVSDYIWRGQSQSNKKAAVQGGIDYAKGDFSFGTWGSSLGSTYTGAEIDLYASYKAGPVTIGGIYYYYPLAGGNFYEINVGGDLGPVGLMYSYNPDTQGSYAEASYSLEMTKGVSLDLHAGYGDKNVGTDYSIGISGSAGGLDLAVVGASHDTGGSVAFVSVGKSM